MAPVRVLHRIPGRVRVRLPQGADPRDVVAALEGQPGLLSWQWSQRTRSLLIVYDGEVAPGETVLEIVTSRLGGADLDPGPPQVERPAGPPALAVAISQGMAELDAAVASATRGLVDLRLLFPVGLFAWAVLELSRGAIGPLAWSSALWYAHGLFRDYNLPDHGA